MTHRRRPRILSTRSLRLRHQRGRSEDHPPEVAIRSVRPPHHPPPPPAREISPLNQRQCMCHRAVGHLSPARSRFPFRIPRRYRRRTFRGWADAFITEIMSHKILTRCIIIIQWLIEYSSEIDMFFPRRGRQSSTWQWLLISHGNYTLGFRQWTQPVIIVGTWIFAEEEEATEFL